MHKITPMTTQAKELEQAQELFPVRFDITTENERITKDVQALIQFQEGTRLDLRIVRRMIYERGIDTYRREVEKLKKVA